MQTHIVQQGECLSSLAARYGLSSWKDIYDHPANATLKKIRPNPNILAPGDEVQVPDRGPAKRVTVAVEEKHRFVVKLPTVKLRVAVVDGSGKPQEGKRFVVNVGAREIVGTTAGGGLVEVQVRATESTARLRVWLEDQGADALPTIDRPLSIGHLDPIDTIAGVQGRLSNLGYRCPRSGELDGDLDDPTLVAARAFRAKNELPAIEQPPAAQDDAAAGEPDAEGEEPRGPTQEEIDGYVAKLIDDSFRKKLLAAYEARGGA